MAGPHTRRDHGGDGRQRHEAGPTSVKIRRAGSRLFVEPSRMLRRTLLAWRGQRGFDKPRRWRRRQALITLVELLAYAATLVWLFWVGRAAFVFLRGHPSSFPLGFNPDSRCGQIGTSCGAFTGAFMPFLTLAVAFTAFLFFRLRYIPRAYVRKARRTPREVVPTAGRLIENVVGRDDLCAVIMENLRDPYARPHVIVGGVGTGKTAVLVRMTELLARRGAVPIAIRLRDAKELLDFEALAEKTFNAEVSGRLWSKGEGERLWRRLRVDGRIVVLADGLEEALVEESNTAHSYYNIERDNRIRQAIAKAREDCLPLVIASRPHDPLHDMDAAMIQLERLSEEAALGYVELVRASVDEHRLDWVIETADVAELPLYLQIVRQLHESEQLEYLSPQGRAPVDSRDTDRVGLRSRLLEAWNEALVEGYICAELPLSREQRVDTLVQLSALACAGLLRDTAVVDLTTLADGFLSKALDVELERLGKDRHSNWDEGEIKRDRLNRRDVNLAVSRGARLKLVDPVGGRARFVSSIMQAYLGSRFMPYVLASESLLQTCLRKHSSRELLMALVFYARGEGRSATMLTERTQTAHDPQRTTENSTNISDASNRYVPRQDMHTTLCLLQESSDERGLVNAVAFDRYNTALEITAATHPEEYADIADRLAKRWHESSRSADPRVEEAKLRVIQQLGERSRLPAKGEWSKVAGQGPDGLGKRVYSSLWTIAKTEEIHSIRLAATKEIAAGGDRAFDALEKELSPKEELTKDPDDPERDWSVWREVIVQTWLIPMFAYSTSNLRKRAQRLLHATIDRQKLVSSAMMPEKPMARERQPAVSELKLTTEIALAQGFKHAENHRCRTHEEVDAHGYLMEKALELLRLSEFWFTQLTLIHALCLGTLAMQSAKKPEAGSGMASGETRMPVPQRHREPEALVQQWLDLAGNHRRQQERTDRGQQHPFVVQAAKFAGLALASNRPEPWLWGDEGAVVGRIGSHTVVRDLLTKENVTIPDSVGWSSLHPQSQQLLADVMLLLNLAGSDPNDPQSREESLRKANRRDLPPCVTRDRSSLDPLLPLGGGRASAPGTGCSDGCPFELCPYPPKRTGALRVEISEPFCHRQYALLSQHRLTRSTAPWQGLLPSDLKRFWDDMATRARR